MNKAANSRFEDDYKTLAQSLVQIHVSINSLKLIKHTNLNSKAEADILTNNAGTLMKNIITDLCENI